MGKMAIAQRQSILDRDYAIAAPFHTGATAGNKVEEKNNDYIRPCL